MVQEPRMRLQTPDARARRQAIREQLAVKLEGLAQQQEKLDREIEELGLGDLVRKAVNKVLGKEDKNSPFDDKRHPRGKDGRFIESPNATKEEKDYNEAEFKKWSETIAQIDADTKRLEEERKKTKSDPNRRPLSNEYLDKMVDLDKKIKDNDKKRKKLYDRGPTPYSKPEAPHPSGGKRAVL